MTIDTLQAEDEMTGPRRFAAVEDMVMFHHPEWSYLTNSTLPVRPPTEVEAAAYAARHTDDRWAEIYSPAEPRIILPPSAPEITAMLEHAPEPEAIEGVALPDHPQLADIQEKGLDSLTRWGADTGQLSVVRDDPEPEVHHNDTQVLHVVPEPADE